MSRKRKQRLVSRTPLKQLWNDDGYLEGVLVAELGADEISAMLQDETVNFVVACVGGPLRWIPPSDAKSFWDTDAKRRIVEPTDDPDGFSLDDFPDNCAYVANLWRVDGIPSVVVITVSH